MVGHTIEALRSHSALGTAHSSVSHCVHAVKAVKAILLVFLDHPSSVVMVVMK